ERTCAMPACTRRSSSRRRSRGATWKARSRPARCWRHPCAGGRAERGGTMATIDFNQIFERLRAGDASAARQLPLGDLALTRERLLAKLRAGEPLLVPAVANLDLSGVDLSGLALDGIGFHGCNLKGAVLRGCSMRRTMFLNCDLSEAVLEGARLDG